MKIELYHGTSKKNADLILKQGFKDRVNSKESNWEDKKISQKGFVYLTNAYPFFYGSNAGEEEDNEGSVLKVIVDTKNLYPDEDMLRCLGLKGNIDLEDYKYEGKASLRMLGNIAIKPKHIEKILGRKDFNIVELFMYSDPSISVMNYEIMGKYYRDLTNDWWEGKKLKRLNHVELFDTIKN